MNFVNNDGSATGSATYRLSVTDPSHCFVQCPHRLSTLPMCDLLRPQLTPGADCLACAETHSLVPDQVLDNTNEGAWRLRIMAHFVGTESGAAPEGHRGGNRVCSRPSSDDIDLHFVSSCKRGPQQDLFLREYCDTCDALHAPCGCSEYVCACQAFTVDEKTKKPKKKKMCAVCGVSHFFEADGKGCHLRRDCYLGERRVSHYCATCKKNCVLREKYMHTGHIPGCAYTRCARYKKADWDSQFKSLDGSPAAGPASLVASAAAHQPQYRRNKRPGDDRRDAPPAKRTRRAIHTPASPETAAAGISSRVMAPPATTVASAGVAAIAAAPFVVTEPPPSTPVVEPSAAIIGGGVVFSMDLTFPFAQPSEAVSPAAMVAPPAWSSYSPSLLVDDTFGRSFDSCSADLDYSFLMPMPGVRLTSTRNYLHGCPCDYEHSGRVLR